jgi:hypothetical protein
MRKLFFTAVLTIVTSASLNRASIVPVASFENWINITYIAGFALILIAALLAAHSSRRRSAEQEAESTKVQLEIKKRLTAANQRAAAANEAAASAALAQEQLRKEILDLSVQLEREKRLRLEMEERILRQRPVSRVSPETPPRVLTAWQENETVRILCEFAGTCFSVIEIEDPEAGPLARQIVRIALNAGLQAAVSRFGALVPAQYGIICTHGPKEPAAAALVRLLRSFNLLVYERAGTPGQVEIVVGLKP